MNKYDVYIVYGPTGSGKSKFVSNLFSKKPETTLLISIDSRKVYKELDIGTNKFSILNFFNDNNLPIKHLLGVNLFPITTTVNVSDYIKSLQQQLDAILQQSNKINTIIIFGGSALYLNALVNGIDTINIPRNEKLRAQESKLSVEELQTTLLNYDPEWLKNMNPSDKLNKRRLLRKIELAQFFKTYASFNTYKSSLQQKSLIKKLNPVKVTWVLPKLTEEYRDNVYEKINQRVLYMFKLGWLHEVYNLIKKYNIDSYADIPYGLKIMGYNILTKFLLQNIKRENSYIEDIDIPDYIVQNIQQQHRNYAKQQMSWVRKFKKGYM